MDQPSSSSHLSGQFHEIQQGNPPLDPEIDVTEEVFNAIDRIVETYEIQMLNPFRKDKKLLVLDADCTLVYKDGSSRAHLHEMLARIYRDYDIALWSAEEKKKMLKRIQALGLLDTEDFRFAFVLDKNAMIPVIDQGVAILVKPLCIIWRRFSEFTAMNTITFDDNFRNYALNPTSGISTYRSREEKNSMYNRTLLKVAAYLRQISTSENFHTLDHVAWMQSLQSWRNQRPVQARIVGGDIPVDVLAVASKVKFELFSSSATLQPPSLTINENGYRLQKFTLETNLSIAKVVKNPSEALYDIEDANDYVHQLEEKTTSDNVKLLNPFSENKKLLVLDFDSVLCDPEAEGFPCLEAKRPYLIEFLSRVYPHYDIVIWSAKSSEWLTTALEELKIINNQSYKITSCLSADAVISVNARRFGNVNVKPLEIIWGKFPRFSAINTIAIGDMKGNFMMNPQSELEVKPYKISNDCVDLELRRLARYLETISLVNDFTRLNHGKWRCVEKLSRIDEEETVDKADNTFQVIIRWNTYNQIELMNVHEDVTIENVKQLFFEATGFGVEHQNLIIRRLFVGNAQLQPYIDEKMIICHRTGAEIIDQVEPEPTNERRKRRWDQQFPWDNRLIPITGVRPPVRPDLMMRADYNPFGL